jgi:hypothetical protein
MATVAPTSLVVLTALLAVLYTPVASLEGLRVSEPSFQDDDFAKWLASEPKQTQSEDTWDEETSDRVVTKHPKVAQKSLTHDKGDEEEEDPDDTHQEREWPSRRKPVEDTDQDAEDDDLEEDEESGAPAAPADPKPTKKNSLPKPKLTKMASHSKPTKLASHSQPTEAAHEAAAHSKLNKAAFTLAKPSAVAAKELPPPSLKKSEETPDATDEQIRIAIRDPLRKKVEYYEYYKWFNNEGTYVKVESLILMFLIIWALIYIGFVELLKNLLYRPRDIKELYLKNWKKSDEGGDLLEDVESHTKKYTKPMPVGAAMLYKKVLRRFSSQVVILVLLFFTVYCYTRTHGDSEYLAEQIRKHLGVEIYAPGLNWAIFDIMTQLFIALALMFLKICFTVELVLAFQKRVAIEREQSHDNPEEHTDYAKLRCLLVMGYPTASEETKEPFQCKEDNKNFDFARYLAVVVELIMEELMIFSVWSWILLGVFEFFLHIGVAESDVGSETDTAIHVTVGCFGPLVAFILLIWMWQQEAYCIDIGNKLRKKQVEDADTHLSSMSESRCNTNWPIKLLQAASFFTCFAVARIIAARRTYYGGWYGSDSPVYEIILNVVAYLLLYTFQVFVEACVVVRATTVFALPPYMDKEKRELATRIHYTCGGADDDEAKEAHEQLKNAANILNFNVIELTELVGVELVQEKLKSRGDGV